MKQLTLPADTLSCEAVEFLRAWVNEDDSVGFITTRCPWSDPAGLGIFFAELIKHFAASLSQDDAERQRLARRAVDGFLAEIDSAAR